MDNSLPTAPSSLDPIPRSIRDGMIALGICGLTSLLSTVGFFLFFTYRMLYWRTFASSSMARTQVFMLIYNLFIADIIQASSFVMSFWWISKNKLVGPNIICDAQGLLIQIGDVASGLWALTIAVHTFINIVGQKTIPHRYFVIAVVVLWSFILLLAAVGPIRESENFFVPAGAWCWVSEQNHSERLYLHYIWIFTSELGSVALYMIIFFYLRFRVKTSTPQKIVADSMNSISSTIGVSVVRPTTVLKAISAKIRPSSGNVKSFSASRTYILKSSRHMVVYTFAYVALTLPLATGRALSMAGTEPPIGYFVAAGILIACSGFVDVALYVGTRRLLVTSSLGRESLDARNGIGTQPLVEEDSESGEKSKNSMKSSDLKEKSCDCILLPMDSETTIILSRQYHDEIERDNNDLHV